MPRCEKKTLYLPKITSEDILIRYSVENFLSFFLSFNQRTEFSMIPGKGSLKKEHKAPAINGVSVLKTSIGTVGKC